MRSGLEGLTRLSDCFPSFSADEQLTGCLAVHQAARTGSSWNATWRARSDCTVDVTLFQEA